MTEVLTSEKRITQMVSEIVNAISKYCGELGLLDSTEKHLLIEAIRIVASNLLIATWTRLSLYEVTNKAELGIQEISPRINDESKENVRIVVRQIVDDFDYREITDLVSGISAYEFAKYLESVHAMTAYGEIEFTDMGIQSNGSSTTRRIRGAFYTPSSVVRFICEKTIGLAFDEAIDQMEQGDATVEAINRLMNLRVIDPACGPGAFLVETLNVLKSRYSRLCKQLDRLRYQNQDNPDDIESIHSWLNSDQSYMNHNLGRIYGVDIDPAAAEIASICVSAFVSKESENLKLPFLDTIKPGNSLVSEFLPSLIRPSEAVTIELLSKRSKLREITQFEKRKNEYTEYRETVHEIERIAFVDIDGKRASSIMTDEDLSSNFSWELEFPEVFLENATPNCAGFSFAVMNPPYDILKLNRSEYVRPGQSAIERESAIHEFEKLKQKEKRRVMFFRKSGQYQWSVENVLNLYRLMIERAIQITSSDARLGFIVPSTLLCDSSSRELRQVILRNYSVLGIDDFSEKANVFEGVTQAVCIFRLDKSKSPEEIPIALHKSNSITQIGRSYHMLPLKMIESVSGSSLSIPRVARQSWNALKKIHRWPSVFELDWIANRRGELDLTAYKQFITLQETNTKLVRGNHVSRYAINWKCGSKERYVHREGFFNALGKSSKLNDIVTHRIAGQQISNMSQKWRLKFGYIEPNIVLGNSCNYLIAHGTEDDQRSLMFLLAIMNSHLLNWRFKVTSTNNHVNNNEIDMLPIPSPELMNEFEIELYERISSNASELVRRYNTDIENETEALVFHLYGLDKEEALTILRFQGSDSEEVESILSNLSNLMKTTQS